MPTPVVLHTVPSSIAGDLIAALSDRGIAVRRAETVEESRALLADAAVAVAWRLPEELLEAAPELRWVQATSAGVDALSPSALAERGVVLTSASGVHAEPAGEQVLGYVLAFERGLHRALRQQERGVWERFRGGELAGKTLGVVGLGAIGGRVAELGAALSMRVVGTKRDPAEAPEAVDEVFGPGGLADVLRAADYLVLACPLTDETRGLVGADELRLLGPDGVLVNVARGAVVEQDALVAALEDDAIRGAALDVFVEEPLPADSPLWDRSNVIVTPHVAGSTPRYGERLAAVFADHYRTYREGGVAALPDRAG